MTTASVSRIQLVLPDSVTDHYQAIADAQGKSLAEVIAIRLEKCQSHDAARPLYFGDSDRQVFERILGGATLNTAAAALKRLGQLFAFRLTDPKAKEIASIQLDDLLIERLGTRATASGASVAEYVKNIVKRALMEHCNL